MTVQVDQGRHKPWAWAWVAALLLMSSVLVGVAWRMVWVGAPTVGDAAVLPEPTQAQGMGAPAMAASSTPVGASESTASGPALQARPGEVLAHDLMAEYRATRGTVDARYKGKRLKVLGRMASLEQGESGATLVSLQAEQDLRPLRALMAPAVASNPDLTQALKEGRALVFDCLHQGIVMGEPILSDCRVSLP
jgi:tRNA_anti-like